MSRNILKEAPSTWDGEAAEAHGQHQEGDGHPAGVGEAHHQQQGGLHPKAWGGETSTFKHKQEPSKYSIKLDHKSQIVGGKIKSSLF